MSVFVGKIEKIYNNKKKYRNLNFLIVLVFALIVFSPFLFKYINGDDTAFHLANIVYRSDILFDIPGVIIPNIGNNLGYATGLFYPSLPHVLGSLIFDIVSIFGFGGVAALKFVKLLVILGSAFFMFLFAKSFFDSKEKGMFASLFYITSSYFFTDLFERDSLNESFVFLFIPLIMLGLHNLFSLKNKKGFYVFFICGYIGLMYSHLVMAVWFTLLLLFGLLFFIKDIFKKQNFIPLLLSSIIILCFTSTFTVPMLEHLIIGEYGVEIQDNSYGWTALLECFYKISPIGTGNNWLLLKLPILIIVLCLFCVYKLFAGKIAKTRKKFILMILSLTIISLIICVVPQFWNFVPDFLKNLQFQWRLATFVTFGTCILSVEGLDTFFDVFKNNIVKYVKILILILLLLFFVSNLKWVNFYDNLSYELNISGMGWHREYLPEKALKNKEYFDKRDPSEIVVLKGDAKISIIDNNVPNLTFKVKNSTNNTYVELPRIYYIGYKIIDNNGNTVKYKEDKNGFIYMKVNDGVYSLVYEGTVGYKISFILKSVTIIFLVFVIIKWFNIFRQTKHNNL